MQWYRQLEERFPDLVKFVPSIGKSYEGKDQPAVHITAAGDGAVKIYFQCQIHASKSINHAVPATNSHFTIAFIIYHLQESGFLVPLACMLLASSSKTMNKMKGYVLAHSHSVTKLLKVINALCLVGS